MKYERYRNIQVYGLSEFSCEFLPDGMYGRGCATEFSACVAGSMIPMVCPASLKYDEVSVKCLAAVCVFCLLPK